jgi:predicted transposase YbfD/YdcC
MPCTIYRHWNIEHLNHWYLFAASTLYHIRDIGIICSESLDVKDSIYNRDISTPIDLLE